VNIHPFDALEALMAQGRIIGYEIERKPGIYRVQVDYIEFGDPDFPDGYENTDWYTGPTLAQAVQKVVDALPAVVA
jgi:hypothetical protein